MGLKEDFESGDPVQDDLAAAFEKGSPINEPDTRKPKAYIAKPGTLELDPEGPVHKYVRPGLEALGMAGGGILGAPLGPLGAAGGGALGFAGGSALSSLAERMAGERPPIQSLGQAGRETLDAIKSGGLIESGGRVLGTVASKLMAPFASQFEGQNQRVRQLAEDRGITLDPHEVMQSRPLALGHKVLENIPFTSGMIQRAELDKLTALTKEWQAVRDRAGAPNRQRLGEIGTKIQDQIEKQLDKAGIHQEEVRAGMREDLMRLTGSPLTYKDLGQQTQKAITDLHTAKKGIEGLAWEHARESIPANARVENIDMKNQAEQILKTYQNIPSFLDEPLVKQLGDMMKSGNPEYDKLAATIPDGLPPAVRQKLVAEITKDQPPGWPVQSLLKLRSVLSEKAAEHHSGIQRGNMAAGSSDQYGKVYTEMIKAIDKNIDRYSTQAGSDLTERLSVARKLSGERMAFLNPKENAYVVKAINADAETLDRMLIRPGNAAGFTELKQSIGEAGVKPVKQAFTNRLLGEGGKGADGLAQLRNTLDRYGSQTLAEVYSPTEIKQLYNLADKSKWMKESPVGNPFFREMVRSNPSQVAPAVLSDAPTTAKVLRSFPQMRQPLRQAFIEGLHPNEATPFPTQLTKQLNTYPKDVQRQLFTDEELADFHQLARIVERTRGTVKLAENPSGTAQNLVSFSSLSATLNHPIGHAPQALGSVAIAKLYLSKAGRKLLMEGLTTPAATKRSVELGTKITGILAHDAIDKSRKSQRGNQ